MIRCHYHRAPCHNPACAEFGCSELAGVQDYPPEWDQPQPGDPKPLVAFERTYPGPWDVEMKCCFLYDEDRQDVLVDVALLDFGKGEFFLHQWNRSSIKHKGRWFVSLIALEARHPEAGGARQTLISEYRNQVAMASIAEVI